MCFCAIESPWFEKIPMNDMEKEGLQDNYHQLPYGKNRRLACAFYLEHWMDEMVVKINMDGRVNQLTEEEVDSRFMAN